MILCKDFSIYFKIDVYNRHFRSGLAQKVEMKSADLNQTWVKNHNSQLLPLSITYKVVRKLMTPTYADRLAKAAVFYAAMQKHLEKRF